MSSNQNVLYPDVIEINDSEVIYHKGYVFGYTTTMIKRSDVASVSFRGGVFFVDIVIASKGGEWITARGFSKTNAKEISRILI